MKKFFLIATLFFCSLGAQAETVEIAGANWESSWNQAVTRALREGKPILHLQMLGHLDEKWC
ncbi:MAG: hypothetical protein KC800_01650 [Candidatus Eremiobacteraeota bacterium]|nr:hypothetical protein [Candidatus Eremiobacteraeota bacterium]